MAISNRQPRSGTVIHSDQGTQMHPSGRSPNEPTIPDSYRRSVTVGDCFDNALMEAFWARMQVELLDRQRWRTRIELANAIFEYLEVFHNRQRRHTSLNMLTPIEYETNHYHNNQTVTPLIQVS